MKRQLFSLFMILPFALLLAPGNSIAQTIYTYAGNGTAGYTDAGGTLLFAEFNHPWGLAFDKSGDLYISDYVNSAIRKISAGSISTYAGSSGYGYGGDGMPATCGCVFMKRPTGIAIDKSGNLYIADQEDNRIRMVDQSGNIYTVAGTGAAGYSGDGGVATAATFSAPTGVAVDNAGDLYVADYGNNVIRRISATGMVSTFAGTGAAGYSGDGGNALSAKFSGPISVALDSTGNLFVADYANNVVRKIDKRSVVSTYAGTGIAGFGGDGGPALSAQFNGPNGLALDQCGAMYVVDQNNNRLRKISAAGNIHTIAGNGTAGYTGDNGLAANAKMYTPHGVAIDANGNPYVADFINNVVRMVACNIAPALHSSYTVTTCQGVSVDIDSALSIIDTNSGQTEVWSLLTAPMHGTLNGIPASALSNGSITLPSGVTYTPAPNYSGPDVFKASISDGWAVVTVTINITVKPQPSMATPLSQTVCNGDAERVHFNGDAGATFTWTNNNPSIGIPATGTGDILSFTAMNSSYSPAVAGIIVTPWANGCAGDRQPFTITVNPTPDVTPLADQVICNGRQSDAVAFSSHVLGATFAWTNNTPSIGMSGSGTGDIPQFTASNSGTTVVVATVDVVPSANGCTGARQEFSITVNPTPPVAQISLYPGDAVCTGVLFQNFGADNLAPAGTAYTWSAAGAEVSDVGSTQQYALVNFKTGGNATVNLTTTILATGCQSVGQRTTNVTASDADAPAQVIYFNHSFVCLQNDEDGYEWGFDDASTLAPTVILGEMNQDYYAPDPDIANRNYWVKVTHNGCIQKAYYNKPSGSVMKQSGPVVKVYPNPAHDNVELTIDGAANGDKQVEIVNTLGQTVYSTTLSAGNTSISLAGLSAGCYFLNCYQGGAKLASTQLLKY